MFLRTILSYLSGITPSNDCEIFFNADFKGREYQRDVIDGKSRVKIVQAGRMIGLSTMLAMEAARTALSTPRAKVALIVSSKEEAKVLNRKLTALLTRVFNGKLDFAANSRGEATFNIVNGSQIILTTPRWIEKDGELVLEVLEEDLDLICMDSTAWIEDAVVQAVDEYIAKRGWVRMLAGSSIKSKAVEFKRWCEKAKKLRGWKHFHLPMSVAPFWNATMEREMRSVHSDFSYRTEALALFD